MKKYYIWRDFNSVWTFKGLILCGQIEVDSSLSLVCLCAFLFKIPIPGWGCKEKTPRNICLKFPYKNNFSKSAQFYNPVQLRSKLCVVNWSLLAIVLFSRLSSEGILLVNYRTLVFLKQNAESYCPMASLEKKYSLRSLGTKIEYHFRAGIWTCISCFWADFSWTATHSLWLSEYLSIFCRMEEKKWERK